MEIFPWCWNCSSQKKHLHMLIILFFIDHQCHWAPLPFVYWWCLKLSSLHYTLTVPGFPSERLDLSQWGFLVKYCILVIHPSGTGMYKRLHHKLLHWLNNGHECDGSYGVYTFKPTYLRGGTRAEGWRKIFWNGMQPRMAPLLSNHRNEMIKDPATQNEPINQQITEIAVTLQTMHPYSNDRHTLIQWPALSLWGRLYRMSLCIHGDLFKCNSSSLRQEVPLLNTSSMQ